MDNHFGGTDDRHPAGDIDSTPHGFIEADNVDAALTEIADDLMSTDSSGPGAELVGADAVTGTPNSLPPGHVASQLAQLLAWLNTHQAATSSAHNASAIAAGAHNYISGTNVQAQLQEIVDDLLSQDSVSGAGRIGNNSITGTPNNVSAGTLRAQLSTLLGHVNTHIGSDDHDSRYYNDGTQVDDSDRLDGQHASAFATAGHDHDDQYLRLIYYGSSLYSAGQTKTLVTITDHPDVVSLSYNYVASGGGPEPTRHANGARTSQIFVRLVKSTTALEWDLVVENGYSGSLFINVSIHSIES
ncbi:MAG: hypothetical protein GY854_09075 [Deltaproteobacteria bacterium]|nr:hypothetical protein [Deltaproteobacteria bacterium]